MDHYPENSLTSYSVQFTDDIIFSPGQWEVGLIEMQFEKSWYNLQKGRIKLSENSLLPKNFTFDYANANELCRAINRDLKTAYDNETPNVEFDVSSITGKVLITFKTHGLKLDIDKALADMLGYVRICRGGRDLLREYSLYDFKREALLTINADLFPNMFPVKSIYVYSDIVENTRVGDVEAPLLRIIPVNNKKHWTTQYVEYQNIQYIPVSKKRIRHISIYLRSDTGEIIPFTTGRTIVTLDFRRVKLMTLV
jgi:hypothetical protein